MTIDDLPSTIFLDSANFDAEAAMLGTDGNWMDLDDLEGDNELLQMVGTPDYGVIEENTSTEEADDFMAMDEDKRELPPLSSSSPLPGAPVSSSSHLKRTDTSNVYPIHQSSSFDAIPQQTRSFDSQISLPARVSPSNSFEHNNNRHQSPPQRAVPRRSVSCNSYASNDNSVLLQMQYQEGLRKLAKSMRHTDKTRSVIKRQRKIAPSLSFCSTRSRDSSYAGSAGHSAPIEAHNNSGDFFLGPRCKELEDSRQKIFRMLHENPPSTAEQS